jgi:hopanoid biosynthesis associated RND transporter like protein HpnN
MKSLDRLLDSLFAGLFRFVAGRPRSVLALGMALAVASAVYAGLCLKLDSDQDSLVSPDLPYQKNYLKQMENFGDQEYLFLVIRTGGGEEGKDKAARFAETVAARLAARPDLIQAVHYKLTAAEMGDGALYFASLDEARALAQAVAFLSPHLAVFALDPALSTLADRIGVLFSGQAGGAESAGAMADLAGPALNGIADLLAAMDAALAGRGAAPPSFDLGSSRPNYFFTANGRLLVMRILPAKDFGTLDVVGEPLAFVREAVDAARAALPGVEAGLTGRPALSADEMNTTDADMTRAGLIAAGLLCLLFAVILRGWRLAALLLLALGTGIAWTYGFATLAVGRLNLLSIVFALVLMGLGVDYGVYVIARFLEARRGELPVEESVRVVFASVGPGVFQGAATTICAFFAVLGSDFTGLAELGLIGGAGIILCLTAMFTILPALLLLAGRAGFLPATLGRDVALPGLERLTDRPRLVLLLAGALGLAALPFALKTGFSYNLLELQARGLESVHYEKVLVDESEESTWYAILVTKTLDEARVLAQKLKALPGVGKVESVLDFLPPDQPAKAALFAEAAKSLRGLPETLPDPGPPDAEALLAALGRLEATLSDLAEKIASAGAGEELAAADRCLTLIGSLRERLGEDKTRAASLAGLQDSLRRDIERSLAQLRRWLAAPGADVQGLPAALKELYVGRDGSLQIKAVPKEDVWDFDALARFVTELRNVDPLATGVPVGVYESARLMHRTFLSSAGLTLALVVLILWAYSRRIDYVLLALLPLGAGVLWLLATMRLCGLEFNLANFFAIPILIGIGADGSVLFLARWRELSGRAGLFSTSTPTAVSVSYTSALIGFGGLLFAHHRGLASLGGVVVIGCLTILAACLFVLPAALKAVGYLRKQ